MRPIAWAVIHSQVMDNSLGVVPIGDKVKRHYFPVEYTFVDTACCWGNRIKWSHLQLLLRQYRANATRKNVDCTDVDRGYL